MAATLGKLEDGEMDQLETWIGTGPKQFSLLYSATRDGCVASIFHQKCDNQGPTLTVLYNPQGSVYGGYIGQSWNNSSTFTTDTTAFLFQLKFSGNKQRTKFPVVNSNTAIQYSSSHGPLFGGVFHTFSGTINASNGVFALNGTVYLNDVDYKTSTASPKVKSWNDINNGNMNVTELEVYKVTDGVRVKPETNVEWRKTGELNAKMLERLKEEIQNMRPPSDALENFRLLLVGPVGSGKSSFCNTVASVFRGRITQRTMVGESDHGVTTAYTPIPVRDSKGHNLHFLLCDTPGIEEKSGLELIEANFLLGGHVPDFYEFNPVSPLNTRHPSFVLRPQPSNHIHCLAFVMDASEKVQPDMLARFKGIRKLAMQLGIPQVVLLTKVDKVDASLATDVSTVFKNTKVKEVVTETARLFGIPANQVLLVKNYETEMELDTGLDILALLALKKMLYSAEDHLDNAQMREAASSMRVGGADNVQGRRAREVETASESI